MTASPRPAFARVLCPTDFSEFSTAALSYAAALAASYGSAIRILHVLTPFPIVAPFGDVPGNGQLYESQRVQGRQALEAEAARVRRPGLTVDVELRDGSAVHETLDAARDWGADLIVIGTHGRGGMERVVLGSVDNVLRPILLAGRTSASGLVVFIGLLGGVSAFGFVGIVLGPIVLVITGTLIDAMTRRVHVSDESISVIE